ncbi:HAD hydrolase family protein, partial [Staphylococcus capitis]|uniref:HAD hydrolase family protein n=1 Tax=Staphylococcus capitis TaxID=29388 RepID=UPI000D4014F9
IDIAERAGQSADVDKIKAGIQKRIDNGTLKVVDNYDKIEDTPGEIVMKILAFDSDLSKIDRVSEKLAQSESLAISSSSRGKNAITHSETKKGIALETIAERLNIDMKNVMAIGDNMNDISMLERVG